MSIGFFLSCEEYTPAELVEQARLAEEAGFEALWISDHYHPWTDAQGQSPFVWSVIGAISQVCQLPVTTAVTCPIMRMHPAIVAQAAATAAVQLDGRFRLGVGTGEALNEHIVGRGWPEEEVRLEMLDEAVSIMRDLWSGQTVSHRGPHFTVENARVYTRPDGPIPVYVSAFGDKAFELACRIGDGFITTSPDADRVARWRERAPGRTAQGGVKVCVAPTVDEAAAAAHRRWATSGLPGELSQVLPSPRHFEQAAALVTEEMTRASVPLGPDPQVHLRAVREYVDAGFDEVYVAPMGPYWRDLFPMFAETVLPAVRG